MPDPKRNTGRICSVDIHSCVKCNSNEIGSLTAENLYTQYEMPLIEMPLNQIIDKWTYDANHNLSYDWFFGKKNTLPFTPFRQDNGWKSRL